MSETQLDEYMKTIDLKELFVLWKEEHKKEVEDIKEQIKNMKSENSKECDGEIFRKKIYNECTISSHFIQFFYREQCKKCADIKEKTAWEYVLENAFNADGCVGNYDIAENGYKYIALLKEANDSDKCCVRENYQTEEDIPNRWLTDWRKDKNNRKYNMLNKLNSAFYQYKNKDEEIAKKIPEKDFFFDDEMAYMNVNKRGGTSSTVGVDQNVLIKYAEKYRKFILKEIDILSAGQEEVTVFVYGKRDNYFERLVKALCKDAVKIQEGIYKYTYTSDSKDKTIKLVNITHPSGRISAADLAEEMKREGEN